MLVSAILIDVRDLLHDSVVPYRWETADLESYVTFAVREARRLRPDLFMGTFAEELTDLTSASTFPMPSEYAPIVSEYVVSRATMRDDSSNDDSRAVAMLKLYRDQLLGV